MAHANKTFLNNGGTVGYNSLFPNGDAAPPSTGIKIVGTVAHGNLIKIIAGNDVNFGADGPDLFCSMKMDGMTIGTDLDVTTSTFEQGYMTRLNPLNYQTATKFPIHSVSGMPANKGVAVGVITAGNVAKLRAISMRKSGKIFHSIYGLWPATNQANQIALNDTGAQIKLIGHQYIDGFSSGGGVRVDGYVGMFGTTNNAGTAVMEQNGAVCVSNSNGFIAGSVLSFPTSNAKGYYVDSTHQKSNLQIQQNFFVSDPAGNAAGSRAIDTDIGTQVDYYTTFTHPAVNTEYQFDRTDFVQNAQGMRVDLNCSYYVGGWYEAWGEGAACRVEMSDTVSPSASTKKVSVCTPKTWSNKVVSVVVNDPFGLGFVNIYDKNNTFNVGAAI